MGTDLAYPTARAYMSTLATMISVTVMALQVGTGGVPTAAYYRQRGPKGYAFVAYDGASTIDEVPQVHTPAEALSRVRATLKLSVTDLARALGVSRQAIYDWKNGKQINEGHAARLADLAHAADAFARDGLPASAQLLRRPIVSGKSLFDIAREGGSAEDAALQLIQIARRELHQRKMLEGRLRKRKRPTPPADDYGIPILNEVD